MNCVVLRATRTRSHSQGGKLKFGPAHPTGTSELCFAECFQLRVRGGGRSFTREFVHMIVSAELLSYAESATRDEAAVTR